MYLSAATRVAWLVGSVASGVAAFFITPVTVDEVPMVTAGAPSAVEVLVSEPTPAPIAVEAPPAPEPVPTPVVTRSPQEVERSRRCPEFEALFEQHGLVPVDTFSFIAWRETRCDPSKVNAEFGPDGKPTKTLNRDGSYDVGLLQINSTWKTVTHEVCGTPWGKMFVLRDLDCNLRVARYLLDNGGLGHWSL